MGIPIIEEDRGEEPDDTGTIVNESGGLLPSTPQQVMFRPLITTQKEGATKSVSDATPVAVTADSGGVARRHTANDHVTSQNCDDDADDKIVFLEVRDDCK